MGGNQYISQPRVVQTTYLEQIIKSQKSDINWRIIKAAHNADRGSNSPEQMLPPRCASEGIFMKVHQDTTASPPPSLLCGSLRQAYKAPGRHGATAADWRKSTQLPPV